MNFFFNISAILFTQQKEKKREMTEDRSSISVMEGPLNGYGEI
jgi:hypothetical protein